MNLEPNETDDSIQQTVLTLKADCGSMTKEATVISVANFEFWILDFGIWTLDFWNRGARLRKLLLLRSDWLTASLGE